jgi:uncharacterized protein YjbI with pentapeptide repeats
LAVAVLANLLPGVRELRAPLAAGYVWLAALFLAFEPLFPAREQATGIWDSVLTLKDELGPVGLGVAVSFVAYVLGSISESFVGAVLEIKRLIPRRRRGGPSASFTSAERPALIGEKGKAALQDVAGQRAEVFASVLRQKGTSLEKVITPVHILGFDGPPLPLEFAAFEPIRDLLVLAGALGPEPPAGQDERERTARKKLQDALGRAVLSELDLVRTRLLGRENELFSTIDRLHAEADFRFAVAPALVGLSGALAWRATWWSSAITLGCALVLALQGRDRTRRSNEALLEALRVGRAPAPSLERFDAETESLRGRTLGDQEVQLSTAAAFSLASDRGYLEGAELAGADLNGINLSGVVLPAARLSQAILEGANVEGANLDAAKLSGAKLRGARLDSASLEAADLSWADLRSANLAGAILDGADLEGANLEAANLSAAKLQGARLDSASLEAANLSGADLRSANLAGAILREANLEGADLEAANLSKVNLHGAKLESANLSRANLYGATLERGNLQGAKLDSASLEAANLLEAEM